MFHHLLMYLNVHVCSVPMYSNITCIEIDYVADAAWLLLWLH